MVNRLKHQSISLSQLCIFILTLKVLLTSSSIIPQSNLIDNTLIIMAILLVILKFCKDKFNKRNFFMFIVFALIILYTCFKIKQYDLLVSLMAIYSIKDENIDDCIRVMYKTQMIFIVLHLIASSLLSLVGFSETFMYVAVDGRLRFNGGLTHANVLSAYLLSCLLMYIWLNFKKMNRKILAYCLIFTFISFCLTQSRTGLLLNCIVTMFVIMVFYQRRFVEKILDYKLLILYIGFIILTVYTIINYRNANSILLAIDNLLNQRFKLGAYAFERSGYTILPRFIDYVQSGIVTWDEYWGFNTFTFDNLYSFIFIQLGVVWYFILGFILYQIIKLKNLKYNFFIFILLLFSMTEVHGLNCIKFFPLLIIGILLSNSRSNANETTN